MAKTIKKELRRYRKLEQRLWFDAKFRELSPPPPSGQYLFIWLIVGPATTNLPGVVIGSEAELAAKIGWTLEAFREAFREASGKGMVKADWKAGLAWLQNGPRYNAPESPNVVVSWGKTWDLIPECELKCDIYQHFKAFTEGLGKAFAEAFAKGWPHPSGNQEQETGTGEIPLPPWDPVSFGMAWQSYPDQGKTKREASIAAWRLAIQNLQFRFSGPAKAQEWLIQRVKDFAASPKARTKFCPSIANWLEDGRYDDDPSAWEDRDQSPAPTIDAPKNQGPPKRSIAKVLPQ